MWDTILMSVSFSLDILKTHKSKWSLSGDTELAKPTSNNVEEYSPNCTILYSELVTQRHFIIVPAPNGISQRQELYDRFSIRRKEVRRDLWKVSKERALIWMRFIGPTGHVLYGTHAKVPRSSVRHASACMCHRMGTIKVRPCDERRKRRPVTISSPIWSVTTRIRVT